MPSTPGSIILVGSGYCAAMLANGLLKSGNDSSVTLLEAGSRMLSAHFQASSDPIRAMETMGRVRHPHALVLPSLAPQLRLVGGRAMFWSGWAPLPLPWELDRWPSNLLNGVASHIAPVRECMGLDAEDTQLTPAELKKMIGAAITKVDGFVPVAAPIACGRHGQKFTPFEVWDAPRWQRGQLKVETEARVERLHVSDGAVQHAILVDGKIVGTRDATFVLCAGALENEAILRRSVQHSDPCFLSGHGVVSRLLRVAPRRTIETPLSAMLFRDFEGGSDIQHQVCVLAREATDHISGAIFAATPDAMEMSGQEIETQGPGLYLSVTSVFRLDEDPSTGLGLLADDGGGDLRLLDADRFVERFEARSQIAMAEASRFIAALECQIGHLEDLREPQSKYLVHETLLSNNIPNMPPAVHLAAAPGISNAFLLGANRWPTAGVSNPAVLLGALAHSVATQLTKLGKSPY